MSSAPDARRWLVAAAAYGCVLVAVVAAPLPGPAVGLCLLAAWFALGFALRSYAAALFVLVVPLWDALRGTSSGDLGPAWIVDVIVAVPLGAASVAAGVVVGRRRTCP